MSPLPATHIHAMTDIYHFNDTKNAEVGLRWFELALISPAASDFVHSAAHWVVDPNGLKGRMKFCRPIFRLLYRVDAALATKTFEKNKMAFHPIARKLIAKVCWIRPQRAITEPFTTLGFGCCRCENYLMYVVA
jgi:leukotriene-A4 hydrolase